MFRLKECTGSFSGTGFRDVVTEGAQGPPHAVTGGFFVVNNHQSQRVFSHFRVSLEPRLTNLLAHRVPHHTPVAGQSHSNTPKALTNCSAGLEFATTLGPSAPLEFQR